MGKKVEERPYVEKRYATDKEWADARKGGIGGSDVASIMGINPYSSPLEVWLVKTGRAESPDLSEKESVEWGNRLEPLVAEKFAENHPELKVRRKNCTMVSVKRPWAFANIDRELRDPEGRHGVLEIKTTGMRSADQWVYGPPTHYLCQIQHYLSVTGWDFAWCAVLIGGQEYREFYVPRDEDDIRAIDEAVDEFWNVYVANETIPQLTGQGNESKALTEMYREDTGEYVPTLDSDFPELGERALLNDEIKALEARKKHLDNEIKARIGESRGIESESVRCTWVRSTSRKFDSKRFKEEKPEEYASYEVEYVRDGGLRFSPARD